MDPHIWCALVVATVVLLAIPGPVVLLLLSQTFVHGRGIAVGAISGVVLGDFAAMTISLAGAGAILTASATLFAILKIGGALYLVRLGISLWRSGFSAVEVDRVAATREIVQRSGRWRAFRQAFVVTALNPKDIVFFVAFLPQFIDPARPATPQIAIIVTTFLALVVLSTSLWVTFATQLRSGLNHPSTRKVVARVGAGGLVGAGVLTALTR